jgi:CheY-like chemotaxis protein
LGLGLAIARSMMALHGGSVVARSAGVGLGSTFTVRMPALQERSGGGEGRPQALPSQGMPGGLSVLVVDDNEDAARALGEVLELMGYRAHVAFSAPQALALAPQVQPQVGLLDIGLPGMDGYELAQRLRDMPGGENMRLFAVTGYGQEADRKRAIDAGFEQHLTKPVDLGRLDGMLQGQRIA